MIARSSIRVAVPWLHAVIDAARSANTLPGLDAWRWLVGRGQPADAGKAADWRAWLLGGTGTGIEAEFARWPAGPSLAAVEGVAPGSAPTWAIAQPVHLAPGMDHVRLAPLADAVPHAAEADALAATLQSHFARDTFEICGFRDGAWLVRCADRIVCDTHDPAEVAGRNIHDFMPAGPDGARIRSLMNEVQMLLHDHPVNARRASTRALPINALWYWGFGAYAATPTSRLSGERWLLHADDLWLRAFWRAHGGTERPLNEAGTDAGDALVAMAQPPTADSIESLAEVDSSLFARLVRAMQAGELRALAVHDGARVHTLDRHSRLRLWRRPARGEDL